MNTQTVPGSVERIDQVMSVLADNGVAFKEPLWFAAGTALVKEGKASVRKSQLLHEQKPLLSDLTKIAQEAYDAQNRQDINVMLSTLSMTKDGYLTRGRKGMSITQTCLGQLVNKADGVTYAGPYLAQLPPARRAENVNYHLENFKAGMVAEAANGQPGCPSDEALAKADKEVILRTMIDPATKVRGIYAIVSTTYERYDLPQGAQAFVEALNNVSQQQKGRRGLLNQARCEVWASGPKWKVMIHIHNPITTDAYAVGDVLNGWICLRGQDDGTSALSIEVGFVRTRCVNNTVIYAKSVGNKFRHSKAGIAKLAGEVKKALAMMDSIQTIWEEAAIAPIIDAVYQGDVKYVFTRLVEEGHFKLPGYRSEELVERLMKGWAMEPGAKYTRAAISNAMTWASHTQSWKSYEDIEAIEQQAGHLLRQEVRVLTPEQVAQNEARQNRFAMLDL